MMKRFVSVSLFLTLGSLGALAQETVLTLSQAIQRARLHSVEATVALSEFKTSYWQYRTHRAQLLPEVTLHATLPDYERGYRLYQAEDGAYKYVRNNLLSMSGELSVDQNVWFTGGKLSLRSSLQYLNPLQPGVQPRRFLAIPVGIKYEQPIFGVNTMKWQRRIQPPRYREAQARYLESVEQITLRTIDYYFKLLLAQENLHIARQNQQNSERIYSIAQARREMGQISENEVLQLRLSALKASSALTHEESTLKSAMFRLRSFLGLPTQDSLQVVIPGTLQHPTILFDEVVELATEHGAFARSIRTRQLEADYQLAQAKGRQYEVNLFASIGYTGQSETFRSAYNHLIDQQIVRVGVNIPIIDWGKRKGEVQVAKANRDMVQAKIKQEQTDFNQDLFILVEKYNNQARQLQIAEESDRIARKRYDTSVESFMIGKINTLDLHDAQLTKDEARAKYVSELRLFWYYYYQIRSLTLYDFEHRTTLDAEFERLVRE